MLIVQLFSFIIFGFKMPRHSDNSSYIIPISSVSKRNREFFKPNFPFCQKLRRQSSLMEYHFNQKLSCIFFLVLQSINWIIHGQNMKYMYQLSMPTYGWRRKRRSRTNNIRCTIAICHRMSANLHTHTLIHCCCTWTHEHMDTWTHARTHTRVRHAMKYQNGWHRRHTTRLTY